MLLLASIAARSTGIILPLPKYFSFPFEKYFRLSRTHIFTSYGKVSRQLFWEGEWWDEEQRYEDFFLFGE